MNAEAGNAQRFLEDAAYLLRIPQRKPWGGMSADVDGAAKVFREQRAELLEAVPAADKSAAGELIDSLMASCDRLAASAAVSDAEKFDTAIGKALETLSNLRVLQAPNLPYVLPAKYGREAPRGFIAQVARIIILILVGGPFPHWAPLGQMLRKPLCVNCEKPPR